MAEIHVQTKKQSPMPAWIWIVIGLLIAAAVIYFVTRNKETAPASTEHPPTTSQVTGHHYLRMTNPWA